MKFIQDPVLRTTRQLPEFAEQAIAGGKSFIASSLNDIPLLASVIATSRDDAQQTDETHYFLVPFRLANCGYALFSSRRLPKGCPAENVLPKRRIFHLPAEGMETLLERLVLDRLADQQKISNTTAESIQERFRKFGEEIDAHSDQVTGGLLIASAYAATVSPIAGVGVAAGALLSVIGGKLSREGLKHTGEKLQQWRDVSDARNRRKEARKQLASATVEIEVNPILQTLEKALGTDASEFEPML